MDCNSYSYTPHMLDEQQTHFTPCNRVTIERKIANGCEYYTISAGEGWNTAHDLDTAVRIARNWLKEGV